MFTTISIDGIKFNSKTESSFYIYLKQQRDKGKIALIVIHPTTVLQDEFYIDSKKHAAIMYQHDFYVEYADGRKAYIDVKEKTDATAALKYRMYLFRQSLLPEHKRVPLLWVKALKGRWVNFFNCKPIHLWECRKL